MGALEHSALPHHERIQDPLFGRAVDLVDAGDSEGLWLLLQQFPSLVRDRVDFGDGSYFSNPSLLEFCAENPVRRGLLPSNIVEIARTILEAGADAESANATLGLVCSGRVARECGAQIPLIDILIEHGADPNMAMHSTLAHGEFEAVDALLRQGAAMTLPVAAALGHAEVFARLLPEANPEARHLALAFACQFGRLAIVEKLLDAGENPDRYNPAGAHAQSTPLHQAAYAGHAEVVRVLVERGARIDLRDKHYDGTPADWAHHGGHPELETYLRAPEPAMAQHRGEA
jgi:ankyrin repeat protein